MDRISHKNVDAFIIGGGLAGIHLALAMDRAGLSPLVINRPDPHSSSRIAAGIINPITGRRFALTWMYDKLEPVFTEVYSYWENKWNAQFFEPRNIYRSVPQNKLVNDLDAKLSDPAFQKHCRKMTEDEAQQLSHVIHFKSPGYVMSGYQVDTTTFLDTAINYLTSKRRYVEVEFNTTPSQIIQHSFSILNHQSNQIIWATGASIVQNPLFPWVKMNPNKGEILHVRPEGEKLIDIVKQSAFIVPMKDGNLWVGSYNSWDFDDSQPTEKGLKYLKSKAGILIQPFNIAAHLAAVRPAVEDRRPVIGSHPEHPNIYLFNGFGSKGTSLIPYFAKNLVEHMIDGVEIQPEAQVSRYWS